MLLTVDIGNSSINSAVFDGNNIVKHARINSDKSKTADYYLQKFKKEFQNIKITDCAIISVVNGLDYAIKEACDQIFGINSKVLNIHDAKEIKIKTEKPESVGMDRVANLYAVLNSPLPAIVIDIGTAVTFDILSKDKEFIGGIIMPGLNMSLKALAEGTSKLTLINPDKSPNAIGTDTKTCILSGVIRGTACAIDGLLEQCIKELGECKTVILTGGQAELVSKYMHTKAKINLNNTLEGIKILYKFLNTKR